MYVSVVSSAMYAEVHEFLHVWEGGLYPLPQIYVALLASKGTVFYITFNLSLKGAIDVWYTFDAGKLLKTHLFIIQLVTSVLREENVCREPGISHLSLFQWTSELLGQLLVLMWNHIYRNTEIHIPTILKDLHLI
jgi:hypothetical protein